MFSPKPARLEGAYDRTSEVARHVRSLCPQCAFALTVVHSRRGTTIEYDMAAWGRVCCCAELGTPLLCPCVGAEVWAWLS